jgi:predicted ABC-type ATPase
LGDHVHIDPDQIKDQLPEYRAAVKNGYRAAAKIAHAESAHIAERIRAESMRRGLNVLVDGTGADLDSFLPKLKQLRDHGYKVTLLMPYVPETMAVKRAIHRAQTTGRWVPEQIIRWAARTTPANFVKAAEMAHVAHLYDNTRAAPRLIYAKQGDSHRVLAPEMAHHFPGLSATLQKAEGEDPYLSLLLEAMQREMTAPAKFSLKERRVFEDVLPD